MKDNIKRKSMCKCEEKVINLPVTIMGIGFSMLNKDYFKLIKDKTINVSVTIFKDGNKLGTNKKQMAQNKILSFINNVDNIDDKGIEALLTECKCI